MTAHRRQLCDAASCSTILLAVMAFAGCKSSGPSSDPVTGNNPPVISGNPPASVAIGQTYAFTPNASDADGDPLTFSIQGKPGWADFDASTGALNGTPESGDEGPYEDISIATSDGAASDSLDFSVTVTQTGDGSVTLSWQAPSSNTDGSPLTDLAGYKIYYGIAQGNYTEQVRIDNPGTTMHVVGNLSPNTWYFVATSFNQSNVESDFSGVAVATVN